MVAAARLPNPITVLIVDDEPLLAEAVRAILGSEPRIEIVGWARDGREAVELAAMLEPAVTLMDISMPVMDGFEAIRRIREASPNACTLVLSGSSSEEDIDRARRAGAAGYVTKEKIAVELVDAILGLAGR